MKLAAALAVAFALLPAEAAKPSRGQPAAPSPQAGAPVTAPRAVLAREPDGVRAELTGDGPLLGWAAPRDARGAREVFVLFGPRPDAAVDVDCGVEGAEGREPAHDARLFRWTPLTDGALTLVRAGLPHGSLEAADLDGDGHEDLLLLRDGAIDELPQEPSTGADESLRPVARDEALGRTIGDPRAARSVADSSDQRLRLSISGDFVTYHRAAAGGVAPACALELPIHVVPGRTRIEVRTPEVAAIGAGGSGRMILATIPEPAGGDRLRTLLLEPEAPPGERSVECFAQLPGAERVLDAAFAMRDGHPVLVVTTMSAEKLEVFGEKKLRVFPLGGDRTRAGVPPQSAATTGMNLWQTGYASVVDLDRDGRDDLVLGYWKGLKRTIAALEVHRGEEGGSLAKSKTMEIDLKDGDAGFLSFGADADGDGRPDLIVLADRQAVVFPGSAPGERASRPVSSTPSRRMPLPLDAPGANAIDVSFELGGVTLSRRVPGFGTPRIMDLEGDGRVELVFAGEVGGNARLGVIAFRGAGTAPAGPHSPLASPESSSYK